MSRQLQRNLGTADAMARGGDLPAAQRRWPAWTSYLGLSLCLLLTVTLQLLTTVVVLAVGIGTTAVIAARRGGSVPGP